MPVIEHGRVRGCTNAQADATATHESYIYTGGKHHPNTAIIAPEAKSKRCITSPLSVALLKKPVTNFTLYPIGIGWP